MTDSVLGVFLCYTPAERVGTCAALLVEPVAALHPTTS